MGRVLTIGNRGLGAITLEPAHEYHGAGTTFKSADGTSTHVIVSEGGGNLTRWQTGGRTNIWLNVGTKIRPVPPNGWLYTLGSDGYLSSVKDSEPKPTSPKTADTEVVTTWKPDADKLDVIWNIDYPPPKDIDVTWTAAPGAADSQETAAADGIPMWAWLVGGGLALYFLSRR